MKRVMTYEARYKARYEARGAIPIPNLNIHLKFHFFKIILSFTFFQLGYKMLCK
jgi:hypothetical protein